MHMVVAFRFLEIEPRALCMYFLSTLPLLYFSFSSFLLEIGIVHDDLKLTLQLWLVWQLMIFLNARIISMHHHFWLIHFCAPPPPPGVRTLGFERKSLYGAMVVSMQLRLASDSPASSSKCRIKGMYHHIWPRMDFKGKQNITKYNLKNTALKVECT